MKMKSKLQKRDDRGFTLIEMLLVMVIMGIMLAVIVPRAWRANVDSKYTLCRQNCTELCAFASGWAEQMLLAQDDDSDCLIKAYYDTLNNWVSASTNSNWCGDTVSVAGRNGTNAVPETTINGIIDPSKGLRNPFNGASVFVVANNPAVATAVIPGAVFCALYQDGEIDSGFTNYALLFQGTDSSTYNKTDDTTFYAGQGVTSLGGIRNGVFLARLN